MIYRVFVEKRPPYNIEACKLEADLVSSLKVKGIDNLRLINRYDVGGIDQATFDDACYGVFAEPAIDNLYLEQFPTDADETAFGIEYLPGQFDQRADSAAQALNILNQQSNPLVLYAKIIVIKGNISDAELVKIKNYCINPVDSREAQMTKPASLQRDYPAPTPVVVIKDFIINDDAFLNQLHQNMGLAMSIEDLQFCRDYFRDSEHRDPTVSEIKVIDTYWSDHCRHTTFHTVLQNVSFEEGLFNTPVKRSYEKYLAARKKINSYKDICLMDLATIAGRQLKTKGLLDDLDASEEINACSIKVNITIDGKKEPWLLMFKNETHNHPTEIEPFGGAATCLGGAIRDPLSGRSYVYQAMRLTGCGDPTTSIEQTLPGKLPQRKITREAARGYSSYGNQIGLASGQISEVYDPGFVAKRMEVGAVIGAAPEANVRRERPQSGDLVILLGGRTGRDGCGGATGSSKEHDEQSLTNCGAEVQKGNPPTERKLQRLFRDSSASTLIKRCNDFGAGGVSVAIGELAEGLLIDLDAVPKKYQGLDGTELAISESQERMAVVVAAADAKKFIDLAAAENLEATIVAEVNDSGRMTMKWRGEVIIDIARDFLDTNGIKQKNEATVAAASENENYFLNPPAFIPAPSMRQALLTCLSSLNCASQKGLVEQFDSTVGAATVLMPFGGKRQLTPAVGMAAKLPVLSGETNDVSLMSWGYTPALANWSPYHGALYAVVESVAKIVAMGGNPHGIRLSFQEYFEKLGKDPSKWGKPLAALLGAYEAQTALSAPAIGGKDSMSGSFLDLHVPPTLISFAVRMTNDAGKVLSPEFKKVGSRIVLLPLTCDIYEVPKFDELLNTYDRVFNLNREGRILSAQTVNSCGIAAASAKMCFGNNIGLQFDGEWEQEVLFAPEIGSLIVELAGRPDFEEMDELFAGIEWQYLGETNEEPIIEINNEKITIEEALAVWQASLEDVFPTKCKANDEDIPSVKPITGSSKYQGNAIAKPRVLIPVFPGTNCEYDMARAFERAGGTTQTLVLKNLNGHDIDESLSAFAKAIAQSQIIAFPGGFSAGDEPDGSAKFIVAVCKNPRVREALTAHLEQNDGLILGICNGFQALIKLGLLTYGKICDLDAADPTLTYNSIGRHISRIASTRVVSKLSPWVSLCDNNEIYHIAISHGEGRFVAPADVIKNLFENGQITTQYCDFTGQPSAMIEDNPNGSYASIEGICSPDGRVYGKMGHSERMGSNIAINIPGEKIQPIFASGINYFK